MPLKESSPFGIQSQAMGQDFSQITPLAWVDAVIAKGLEMGASDIHFDIMSNRFLTRFRIDGVLHPIDERPLDSYEMVVARLKIMGVLNSAEHRRPQEGHATAKLSDGNEVDLRISVFPTVFGEAVAIRILNRQEFLYDSFEAMGMRPEDAELFNSMIRKPHGMILVTGPTGSGKSATLYTAINQIRSPEKNIITLEDPVEYHLDLIRQSQVNPALDYTFAQGTRSILRQDPDVVMLGEIRDTETAEVAVRAALTGSLLFSTLHTNDSIGALVRLLEFKIPRSFLATTLLLVVAKRLIRKNCLQCREAYTPSEKILQQLGLAANAGQFVQGKGCPACNNSGYAGRIGIYEFLAFDKELEMMIIEEASYSQITEAALKKGMRTLREEAVRFVLAGETTAEEALHITA